MDELSRIFNVSIQDLDEACDKFERVNRWCDELEYLESEDEDEEC